MVKGRRTPKKEASNQIDSKAIRQWAFEVGDRRSSMVVYRSVHFLTRVLLHPWLRVEARNAQLLDLPGSTVLAPVHRSHLDTLMVATVCRRRLRALGKESLFTTPVVRFLCAACGAIPVKRGEADRDALQAAKALLDRGESMFVFPEGGRQTGNQVTELFDGAAWLASRTQARVLPIGIAGTEQALGGGSKRIRRSTVRVVVGEPMDAPVGPDGKRASRETLAAFTAESTLR